MLRNGLPRTQSASTPRTSIGSKHNRLPNNNKSNRDRPTIVGEIGPPSAALSTPDEGLASARETLASRFRLLEPLSALLEVVETTLPLQLGTKANAPQETAKASVRTAAFIGAVFIRAKANEP